MPFQILFPAATQPPVVEEPPPEPELENVRSLDFGGTNEIIRVTDSASLNFGAEFSASFWVKGSAQGALRALMGQYNTTGDHRGWVVFTAGGTHNLMRVLVSNNASASALKDYNGSVAVLDGAWHHFAFTFDGPGNALKLYVDGVEDASVTKTFDNSFSAVFNAITDFTIGGRAGGTELNFVGKIDEASVWNAELTASHIAEIYNAGVPTDLNEHSAVANLVSWWRMGDDGDSTTLVSDVAIAGNNNHGVPSNLEVGDFNSDVPS